jgi:hypothetical protein
MHSRLGLLRQRTERGQGVQGGGQEAVITPVGRSSEHAQRDVARLHGQGALGALFATVDRAWAGGLAAVGRLGDAPVHGEVLQVQAEQAIVGGHGELEEQVVDAGGDPFVAAAQGARRAGLVDDALVGAANTKTCSSLSKTTRSGDAESMAAKRWPSTARGAGRGTGPTVAR